MRRSSWQQGCRRVEAGGQVTLVTHAPLPCWSVAIKKCAQQVVWAARVVRLAGFGLFSVLAGGNAVAHKSGGTVSARSGVTGDPKYSHSFQARLFKCWFQFV